MSLRLNNQFIVVVLFSLTAWSQPSLGNSCTDEASKVLNHFLQLAKKCAYGKKIDGEKTHPEAAAYFSNLSGAYSNSDFNDSYKMALTDKILGPNSKCEAKSLNFDQCEEWQNYFFRNRNNFKGDDCGFAFCKLRHQAREKLSEFNGKKHVITTSLKGVSEKDCKRVMDKEFQRLMVPSYGRQGAAQDAIKEFKNKQSQKKMESWHWILFASYADRFQKCAADLKNVKSPRQFQGVDAAE